MASAPRIDLILIDSFFEVFFDAFLNRPWLWLYPLPFTPSKLTPRGINRGRLGTDGDRPPAALALVAVEPLDFDTGARLRQITAVSASVVAIAADTELEPDVAPGATEADEEDFPLILPLVEVGFCCC